MCVLSHFRTCDVRAEVRAERVWNCACGSACVWATFKVRFAIALFYLFPEKMQGSLEKMQLLTFFCIHTFDHPRFDGANEQIRRRRHRSARYVVGRLLGRYSAVYYVLYYYSIPSI